MYFILTWPEDPSQWGGIVGLPIQSLCSSVANTAAKPRNWATFDPVLTMKNSEKRVRCSLAKFQLHVSLWALIWRRGLVKFMLATLLCSHLCVHVSSSCYSSIASNTNVVHP